MTDEAFKKENLDQLVAKWKAGDMTALDALLTLWHNATFNSEHWTLIEKDLRKAIFDNAWPTPERGRNLLRINHGMALVGEYKINYKIDHPGLLNAKDFIPEQLFAQVIEYKPYVRGGAYRSLVPDEQRLFAEFITETPGMPGLEIKPANKVRWPK